MSVDAGSFRGSAGGVFLTAIELSRGFDRERDTRRAGTPRPDWSLHKSQFHVLLLTLSETTEGMKSPPDGFHEAAKHLQTVARIAKKLKRPSIRSTGQYLDLSPKLRTAAESGLEAVKRGFDFEERPQPPDAAGSGDDDALSHSSDFCCVTWGDERFTFNVRQAACLCIMWDAYQTGNPFQSQAYILANAQDRYLEATRLKSDAADSLEGLDLVPRLRDVFKEKRKAHPAWQTLIVGDNKGNFGLRLPSDCEDSQNTPR